MQFFSIYLFEHFLIRVLFHYMNRFISYSNLKILHLTIRPYVKGGSISDFFSFWLQSSKKMCQITILTQDKLSEIKPPLKTLILKVDLCLTYYFFSYFFQHFLFSYQLRHHMSSYVQSN